jgi:apoptosis-inducing factor 3
LLYPSLRVAIGLHTTQSVRISDKMVIMFYSRLLRTASKFVLNFRSPASSSIKLYKIVTTGALAGSLAGYSLSSMLCNTETIKEYAACTIDEILEGTTKRIQIGEDKENFILISRVDGKFYATGGKCSHYGAPLQLGYLDGHNVICPWHAAAFDVRNGEITEYPGLDSIPTYPVTIADRNIIVHIPESKFNSVATQHPSKKLTKKDPSNNLSYVVIGGGAAGATAVETLRQEGFTGRIVLVTQEKQLPYDRVVLSKNFKADSSKLSFRDLEFYSAYDIEVQTETEVVSIDTDKKIIKLKNKRDLPYDKVLLATGATARVPGPYKQYTSLDNVFSIRSADDHTKSKSLIQGAADVVIVGSGFLGLEAATSIKRTWPEKNVTIIDVDQKPLAGILGPEISQQLVAVQKANGVNVLLGANINTFKTSNNSVTSLLLSDSEVKADVVIFATGAEVNTNYVPKSLANPNGSLKVNAHLQTENPNVFAAGDIAEFPSLLTETRERVEHWSVAQQQGRIAALNMIGRGNNYLEVPFFWSNQFINVQFVGFSTGHDWSYTETKGEEDPAKASKITYLFKGERCIGVACSNWPGAALRLKIALRRGLLPSKNELLNKTANLETILQSVKTSNPCKGNCCSK